MKNNSNKINNECVPTVYVVDDDELIGDFFLYVGECFGIDVKILNTASDFQHKIEGKIPDLVIMDIVMPDTDGIELVSWLAKKGCDCSFAFMSGYSDVYINSAAKLAEIQNLNVVATMQKPISLETVEALFEKMNFGVSSDKKLAS